MGIFQVAVCIGLLAGIARTQVLQNCSVDTIPLTIGTTEDAAALATSILACPDGDFAVEWVGEVLIEETIHVTGGTSLDIAGAGPGAIADGGGDTQLFAVDGDSRLHLSDMILSNGNASYGGAIFANQSSVSFTGNMSFISNSAEFGGAILSLESILSWNGDSTDFSFNSADIDGGAIWAGDGSSVSWTGDETTFISNNAISGGAITAYNFSTVFWDGDNTTFSNNSAAAYGGGAIVAFMSSTVSWDGDGSSFSFNSAALNGGAIWAVGSTVSWFGDDTTFDSNNAAGLGGAIFAQDSTVAWEGDGTSFISNSDAEFGGAIFAQDDSTVTWEGDCTEFSNNSAALDGGAIWAGNRSTVSWTGSDVAFVSNSAESGGAILAYQLSSVSWADGTTIFSNNSAAVNGGAILAWDSSNVSWKGDGTVFTFNNASDSGGAIFAQHSTVSWDGNGTIFSNNSAAASEGGAVCAWNSSTVSWHGDGTVFTFNKAVIHGGAIFAQDSTVAWEGDDTEFSNNSVANFFSTSGGAILARESTVSWNGDGTVFVSNSGCAVYAYISNVSWVGDDTAFISNSGGAITSFISSNVSWDGDGTEFSYNHGLGGGAIAVEEYSTVAWKGKGTVFISNSVEYDGGAIQVLASTLLMDINTTFRSNFAEGNGGALAISNLDENNEIGRLNGTAFIGNSAETAGGAVYMSDNEHSDIDFTEVMFESNSAGGSGGAVAAFTTGNALESTWFQRCTFLNNRANDSGGAVETLAGRQFLYNCDYAGNSADVGGAMRLGGETFVSDSSFLSNYATSRGLAIAVVSSSHTSISKSSFEGNELYCRADFYRRDVQEEGFNPRYETVCLDCPDWDECFDCTIGRSNVMPTCEASLEHTTASEPGITVETLNINEGYWRATNTSENILECYNTDACSGGMTGADSFCAPGYTGPYCAVCETGYSPSLANTCTRCSSSRRRGLLAATVIAAVVAVLAVAAIFKFLLSTEVEEEKIGWFHSRVLRAVPVQALKIVVVVWQILTQFADAASISYPGVYQDFLSAIDVVNFDLGSVLAAGCLWSGIDFHGRLLVSTLGPFVVVGFLAMTYMIAVRRNRSAPSDVAVVEKIRQRHQTALLLLSFLVYSSVSSIVFQTFACETLDDGIEYLRADYRIRCTDARHKAFEVYAGLMVFVFPVGIPLLYAILLFQHRDVLAHGGTDKIKAQSIAGLWEAYRPERFYYEIVECGRRILLTGVVVFIFPNDAAQIAITMLISFFFFAVFEVLTPYKAESDVWLSRVGHVIVFLSMFDLLLMKVDVSGERDQSQAAFAGLLVAGHVLIVLAVVVEAVVVCYASRKNVNEGGEASEGSHVGSDDVLPVFESAPASWRSFLRQGSVSEKPGPARSVSGIVITAGGQ